MARFAVVKRGVAPTVSTPLSQLVDDYLSHMKAKRVSSRTIEWHHWTLTRVLLPYCERHSVRTPADLTGRMLERLQAELLERPNMHTGKPLSPASVRTYMRSIGHLMRWAKREGEQVPEPPAQIRVSREPRERLTRDEITALEDAARSERDKLLIRLPADTGIRLGELVHLNVDDLIEGPDRKRYLRIRHRDTGGGAKGESARLVPIPRLWPRLKRYIERARPKDSDSRRIFLSNARKPASGKHEPLQERGVQVLISGLAKDVLGKRVHPHLLRYAFTAFSLTKGEMSTVQVARTLGHNSTAMVDRVYADMVGSEDSYDALARALTREEQDDE